MRRAAPLLAVCLVAVLTLVGESAYALRTGRLHWPSAAGRPAADEARAGGRTPGWPSGVATRAENARPGTAAWAISRSDPNQLQGFADHVSVAPSQPVRLYVDTTAANYTVTAYRMGYYGGARARQVWQSDPLPGLRQPAPTMLAVDGRTTHTVSAAAWSPGPPVDTRGWPPGDYLLKLSSAGGYGWWVPLTVRSPTTHGAIVIVNAVTTWQAYDAWGGYSLYHGVDGAADYAGRARVVSFDRPYDWGNGAADFPGIELPVVALAERLGLPVAYATDVDLDADPQLLDGARAVISLGHDEYWSKGMRDAVTSARDAGTNVAFLGANAVYRHIRFRPSALGPDRLQVDYKTDAQNDPVYATDPAAATFEWRDGPDPRPESALTGVYYDCNPVYDDMVAVDPGNWLLAGTGLQAGSRLTRLVGSEFDHVDLGAPTPRPIEVLFHSPVTCGGASTYADAAYYTVRSGAGVFAAGTSSWVCALDNNCGDGRGDATAQAVVTRITTNLLTGFAAGPVGRAQPAHDNVAGLSGEPRG